MNIMDKLPKKAQLEGKMRLQEVYLAKTVKEAEDRRKGFAAWRRKEGYQKAHESLERDWVPVPS